MGIENNGVNNFLSQHIYIAGNGNGKFGFEILPNPYALATKELRGEYETVDDAITSGLEAINREKPELVREAEKHAANMADDMADDDGMGM